MTERFLLVALTTLLLIALSGCVVADGIAHVVKMSEHSQEQRSAQPAAAAPAASPPVASGPEAPAPESAPRATVTTEELPPPKR